MYLLDTSVLLLWLEGNKRLPMRVRRMLDESAHPIYVSAATIWEISIKRSIGKLKIADSFFEDLHSSQFIELPVSFVHAKKVADLPNIHRDPFDRLLIAQAIIEKLTLITSDKYVFQYQIETLKV